MVQGLLSEAAWCLDAHEVVSLEGIQTLALLPLGYYIMTVQDHYPHFCSGGGVPIWLPPWCGLWPVSGGKWNLPHNVFSAAMIS